MNFKKISLGLAALIVAFGLVFSMSAFTEKKSTDLAYQYTGNDATGVVTPGNWTPIPYDENESACDAEGELVCIVQFNENEYSDITDFLGDYANAADVNDSDFTVRHKEPLN